MLYLSTGDSLAIATVKAIQTGDVTTLERLLVEHPALATARIGDACGMSRSLLHVVTDWPGHFPNGAATVGALAAAGADVNARFVGTHTETPLHWAASCNDVAVLDALLDAGADIEAPGAVIGGGTPLADARGFAQWQAAQRLIERGARTTLTDAATLGLMDRLADCFTAGAPPSTAMVTRAFWGACLGGQRQAAEYLLARGADVNWFGYDGMTPLDVARRGDAEALAGQTAVVELVSWLIEQGAESAKALK